MTNRTPKVSVIIPFYNAIPYFMKTIESVLNQSYTNIELILVDDKSKDGSLEVAKRYADRDSRVKIIRNFFNSKVSKSRNRGIKYASGEYIYFLDADDFLELNAIEILVNKAIEENSDIVMMDCYYYFNDNNKKHTKNIYMDNSENWKYGAAWWYILKKDIVEKNSFIRFPNKSIFAEDLCFSFMVLNITKSIAYIGLPLVNYRQHENMITNKNISKYKKDTFCSMSMVLQFIKKFTKDISLSSSIKDFELILEQHKPLMNKKKYQKLKKSFNKLKKGK